MKSILVTGGAGFAGSHLALGLKAAYPDSRVTALDNLKRRGSELALSRLAAGGVEFRHGDIRAPEDLAACGPCNLLIECSAEPSVLAGFGNDAPAYVLRTNLEGAIHCLEHARRHDAGLIFLSTSRVYPVATLNSLEFEENDTRFTPAARQPIAGVSPAGVAETFPLGGSRSLYGATKLCAELLIQEYGAMYGLPAVINRCGVLAGPWQMGKADQGVAALWMARHVFGRPLEYIGFGGAGKQVRDMLHIEDLVELVLLQSARLSELAGGLFNVGGGLERSASLCELTALCREISGAAPPVTASSASRPADIRWYVTDNTRVSAVTGWRPARSLHEILSSLHDWISGNRERLEGILG